MQVPFLYIFPRDGTYTLILLSYLRGLRYFDSKESDWFFLFLNGLTETLGMFSATEALSQTRKSSFLLNLLLMGTCLQRRKLSAAVAATLETSHSWVWELTIGQGHLGIHAANLQWWRPHLTRAHGPASPASATQRAIFSWSSHKEVLGCSSRCWCLVLHWTILNPNLLYALTSSLFHNILPFWDPHRRLIDVSNYNIKTDLLLNNTKLTPTHSSTTSNYFNPAPEQKTAGLFSFLLNSSYPPTSSHRQALSIQIPKALLLILFPSTSSVIAFHSLLPRPL